MAGETVPEAAPTGPTKPVTPQAEPDAKPEAKSAEPATPEAKPPGAEPVEPAHPAQAPETKPEEKLTLLQDEHIQRPQGDLVLTVKIKRLFFFGVSGREVKVLKGDKVVDRIVTDKSGEAFFKLPAGEYTVTSGEISTPISLQKHSTLRMK